LGAIRAVTKAGEPGKIFVLFLSGKKRTISPIFGRPNFTKFAYNTSIGEEIKTFGTEFLKVYRNGLFFQKTQKFITN